MLADDPNPPIPILCVTQIYIHIAFYSKRDLEWLRRLSKPKKSPILIEFAKKVRMRRYELGLTQELVEMADLHVNYIGVIERAESNPSLKIIVILAQALNLSPKELIPKKSFENLSR